MQHTAALPDGWFRSKFDGKSLRTKAAPDGSRVVVGPGGARLNDMLYEETPSLTAPALLADIAGDSHLRNSAAQLEKLNAALPALRLPPCVVPFLAHLTTLAPLQIRRAVQPLQRLSQPRSADRKDLVPSFTLSHAMKKVFPQPSHQNLPPELIGCVLTTYVRGALPHTCGCKAQGSLFAVSSLVPKTSREKANAVYETEMVGGEVVLSVRALRNLAPGEELAFAGHDDLWNDIHALCPCGAGMPDLSSLPPQQPSAGPAGAPCQKLSLPHVSNRDIVQTHLPGRGENGRVAFVLDNVFTQEECDLMSGMAFSSWDNTLQYKQFLKTGPAENYRLLKAGSDLHDSLWGRIHEYCPQSWNGWALGGLNDRARFIQYDRGERFVAHTDGEYSIKDGTRAGWRSFITVQVYLTAGMQGGSTRFINGNETICDSVPKVGRVLVFEHCMRHTGEEVLDDVKKQIIRTEIMYQPSKSPHQNKANHSFPAGGWKDGADGMNLPFTQTRSDRT